LCRDFGLAATGGTFGQRTHARSLIQRRNQTDPALKRRGFVTGDPPAHYGAMWGRVRLRAGAAVAAWRDTYSHDTWRTGRPVVRPADFPIREIAKGVALARRKKTLCPFAA